MKSLELKPTYENLLRTLLNDDIGRNNDIFRFTEIINMISDSCSIALDGKWGTGKTFFVKQTKMILDSYNDFIESINQNDRISIKNICKFKDQFEMEPQVSVYYDAWENDNDSEPVLSLIYSIVNSVNTDFSFSNDATPLKKAAAILEFFTDKDWGKIINSFRGTSHFEEIKNRKEIQKEIKEFLDSLLAERGNRLVIFVDELDRCNPSFAVRLLERIKHYFDNDRITFVFSINALELQHTIKRYYGKNFDACRYLDRFFDLRISIPKPNMSKFFNSIQFDNPYYTFDMVCDDVIKNYNFSLREIAKYLRHAKIAAYEPTHYSGKYNFSFSDGKARLFCLLYIVPIMIGLNIYNRDLYEAFINGDNWEPLIQILSNGERYSFGCLLSNTETFNKEDVGKTFVKVEDKLIEVYNAVFNSSSANSFCADIGDFSFDGDLKKMLLQTQSLLSRYTMIDFQEEKEENG